MAYNMQDVVTQKQRQKHEFLCEENHYGEGRKSSLKKKKTKENDKSVLFKQCIVICGSS